MNDFIKLTLFGYDKNISVRKSLVVDFQDGIVTVAVNDQSREILVKETHDEIVELFTNTNSSSAKIGFK